MQNPFETGHIRNYILLYVSVVVIMILFFVATTLFNDVKEVERKIFDTNASEVPHAKKVVESAGEHTNTSRIKLLDKSY